jgi:hypothetical protein
MFKTSRCGYSFQKNGQKSIPSVPLYKPYSFLRKIPKYRILGKFTAHATPTFVGFVEILNKDI